MELSTQKLIHTFGALADLGQEIAGRGDFTEMVRTSMHLLLGTQQQAKHFQTIDAMDDRHNLRRSW